jgi:hypothetical protein
MKKISLQQMEMIKGNYNVGCSQAAGWLFGGGVALCMIPGLLPLGIAIMASSSVGAVCRD